MGVLKYTKSVLSPHMGVLKNTQLLGVESWHMVCIWDGEVNCACKRMIPGDC